jgi:hypothetical protein
MKLEDQLSSRGVFGAKMNSPFFEVARVLVRLDHVGLRPVFPALFS